MQLQQQQQSMDLDHDNSYAQPAHDQDEYDPANPSFSHEQQPPHAAQEHTHTHAAGHSTSSPPSAKRRHQEELHYHHHLDDSKRLRSTESPASPKSGGLPPSAQRKGLAEAAYDRLLDFQSSGDFELAQVSRAAFASVGALPEFAQVAVIARFTRTPMRDIRDKNGQLMRLYHDYLGENPHISSLQPVSAFIADYTSDPGLFVYGYAPPQPVTGVSPSPVPYRKEIPTSVVTPTASAAHATSTASSSSPPKPARNTQQPRVDEFGRVITSSNSSTETETRERPASRASDPRLARKQQAESLSSQAPVAVKSEAQQQQQQQPVESPLATTKPTDPRRREAVSVASEVTAAPSASHGSTSIGESTERSAPVDPRRRQAPPAAATAPALETQGATTDKSDLYNRLPRNVQNVLDAMEAEGRLQEPINDNVVSRLLHLPEHVALRAVENFSNVDLSHIENLQGFLVGIINRVNEKAIKAGDGDAPFPGASSDSGAYPQQLQLQQHQLDSMPAYERPYDPTKDDGCRNRAAEQGHAPMSHHPMIGSLPPSVQDHLLAMAACGTLSSVDEFGEKCYEVLAGLSEGLANEVLKRFTRANLGAVRNRSGFLIGVVKRCRQEYGLL